MNTPLFMLRCVQLGIAISDLELLSIGMINDMFIERHNDDYEYPIIATKADKLKRSQVAKQLSEVRKGLNLDPGYPVIPFSSETKQGRDEIWEFIDGALESQEAAEEQ